MQEFKVYLIKNKDKHIVYVGLTRQTLNKRFQQHCSKRKLDPSEYCIELVQDNLTQNEAIILEELLINQYQTRKAGFNVSPKSINGYSNYHSEEQKKLWSEERKGKPVSEKHAAKNRIARLGDKNSDEHNKILIEAVSKPVICLNDGKEYPSARAAAKEYNTSYSKISLVCNGKRSHTKGYKFKFMKR